MIAKAALEPLTVSENTPYICLRLMEGADITTRSLKTAASSVEEMIEKYYASHIKTNLDAAAINIMQPKAKAKKEEQPSEKPYGNKTEVYVPQPSDKSYT